MVGDKSAFQVILEPRTGALRLHLDPVDHDLRVAARLLIRMDEPVGLPLRQIGASAADRDESLFDEDGFDQRDGAERDSLAGESRLNDLVVLIVAQDAFRPGPAERHGMQPVGPVQPGAARVVVFDPHVARDGGGVEAGDAERGMGDRNDGLAEQPMRPGRRLRGGAIAYRDVRALAIEVQDPVVRRHALAIVQPLAKP